MRAMVCIGDSLTEGTDIPVGRTWPQLVANELHLEVVNAGIGGDTTQGMLARFYPQVIVSRPRWCFILGGTNDLWWGWEVNTVLGNVFSMVVQARHHGIVPAIGLPLPVNVGAAKAAGFSPPLDGYDRFADKLAALVEALIFHARDSEVAFVDLHRPFLEETRKVRSELFLADGLHPNPAGHLTIAGAVGMAFRRYFNVIAGGSTEK